ncbi:flagellar basal-body rod protein FlgF [bacterium (Candidatus Blackallbacteria) CG17_big_fil_post_rev_8_21_14_2_50_48_46]|uniref:Flagellar basal-body rod protein FlgF n=1 Tax=bacterium (Candidatus Blackallbacteria) CG17_big_fil_post_rev_8_21_14_2_50_48_46 TaxID=2014261 RepID=A0A2M7G4A6_9BACT|nr:MAG: flagellar basal-body rod protein FlgF [bacterium (Candidatus Blackallbacteria) CG18_big_fil_WC_8_21_14_2_50_49_26]PIW16581.1 MAG: flagellar basal-body rod protein FlgF [bacterium (Candidatus Blackallbacteria) CG17_big_fil_post_rev_8_21_14_2_50_48_46]PIW46089.1 MAG: flagellar basal-body rod protein FlgF [bacterium (Candidatus Blackallbacteria) CG13_big_fil_rev_8_21_14_2_50_49_14]
MSSRGLYTAASAMMMDMVRMDTVANNLANVNTTGYKRQQTLHHDFRTGFIERLKNVQPYLDSRSGQESIEYRQARNATLGELGTGTVVSGAFVGFEDGALEDTGNSLDLALQGTGFFAVETPNGVMYTRNGAFTRNEQGELVTAEGFRVLGDQGPIQLPEEKVNISEKGEIYAGDQYLDSLQRVDFVEPWSLIRRGSSFFAAPSNAPQLPPEGRVLQGKLERANVETAREMVQMITALRSYQMSQKALQTEDEMTGRLINDLGRPA